MARTPLSQSFKAGTIERLARIAQLLLLCEAVWPPLPRRLVCCARVSVWFVVTPAGVAPDFRGEGFALALEVWSQHCCL